MTKKLEKQLTSNKRKLLSKALRSLEDYRYSYVEDFDEEAGLLFIEKFDGEAEMYKEYKLNYTANDDYSQITIQEDATEVVELDMFMDVVKSQETKLDKVLGYFEKHFGGSSKEVAPEEVLPVIKQFDESSDEMVEISPMYCGPDEVDAHGDAMTSVEIEKMVSNANKAISDGTLQSNFDHKDKTDGFTFIKAFVAECDMSIGGHTVSEGTPLLKVKYVDKDLWEARKSGSYTGWSIGAKAGSVVEKEI